MGVTGDACTLGIRPDRPVDRARQAKVQMGNQRARDRASTRQPEESVCPGPTGATASAGSPPASRSEPGPSGVSRASKQHLGTELRRARTSWTCGPLWVCPSPRLDYYDLRRVKVTASLPLSRPCLQEPHERHSRKCILAPTTHLPT